MLLAIDTATSHSSLALHDGHAIVGEITWLSANNHTLELAPAVQALLSRANLTFANLTALAVAIGPGSYSALRIGVAFAKGIAGLRLGTETPLPLVGVTTLDITALAVPHSPGDLIPVVQAGRTRVTAARYTWSDADARWRIASEMQNYAWEDLIAEVRDRKTAAWFTGEVDVAGAQVIASAKGAGIPVTLMPSALRLRRAGFLAQEAWSRLSASEHEEVSKRNALFDAAALVPVYVKTNL